MSGWNRPSRRTVLGAVTGVGAALAIGTQGPAFAETDPEGTHWPADQELPSFARPLHLDVASLDDGVPMDVRILITGLQGLVNRTRPEIYLITGNPTEGKLTWLEDSGVPYRMHDDPWQVIDKYVRRAKGLVIYDSAVPETINVATTLAGLRDGVIVSAELADKLGARPYGLKVIDDFRGRFGSTLEATAWQFENLWPQATHRVLFGISPSQAKPLPPDNWKDFSELIREDEQIRDGSNRAVHDLDLTPFLGGDAVWLRFTDAFPADGWGPAINHLTLTADGEVVANLLAGTDEERAALFDRGGSTFKPETGPETAHRFADGSNYFVYELPVPAGTQQLTASVDVFNQYVVSASKVRPAASSDDRIPYSLQLRDYAVATRAMPFWLASNDAPEEAALMDRIFAAVPRGTPYLGWYSDEFSGVRIASRRGVYTLAADFLDNATVLGGVPARVRPQRPVAAPALENKVYLTFTFSEGDNLQYDQHHMRVLWEDAGRGKVPLNWSISPLIRDVAPMIWAHYQRTATPNDLLVAGPSGAGYFYPSLWPADDLPAFLRQSRDRYLRQLGLDVMYALDDGSQVPANVAQAFNRELQLRGVVFNMWGTRSELVVADQTMPVSSQLGIGNRDELVARILAQVSTDYDGSKPLFVAVGIPAWDLTPTDIGLVLDGVVEALGANAVAVRGDQYFDLVRRHLGLPAV